MAREVRVSGRTVYLPDREEWEETPTEPAPRAGPYALTVEVSGFVEHERRCSGCGEAPPSTLEYPSQHHFVPAPGGWRKCGEWR
jgi:hypothetical protein